MTDTSGPGKHTKTREHELLQIRMGQKKTKILAYDLLRITVGKQEPPGCRNTIPVALHAELHVVLQGTLRDIKGVAVLL